MKDLKPIRGRTAYIHKLIDEGEHLRQDFKYAVNDPFKIAHTISAFANAEGGRLLIGVRDNGSVAGVRSDEDGYVVLYAASSCCFPPQDVDMKSYSVGDSGLTVLVATVGRSSERPVFCRESDGSRRAYLRVSDENIAAHPLLVRSWELIANTSTDPAISFSSAERMLLELIDSCPEGMNPDEFMTMAHLSRQRADDTIARLCAIGVIGFEYINGAFRLVTTSPE